MATPTYHQYLDEICANCGGTRGQHNNIDNGCPKDILCDDNNTEYRVTVFKSLPTENELQQQTIVELKAENIKLRSDLTDARELIEKVFKEAYGRSRDWNEFRKHYNI